MRKSFVMLLMVALLFSPALAFAEDATTTPIVPTTEVTTPAPVVEAPVIAPAPVEAISAEQQAKTALEVAKAAEAAAKEARIKAQILAKEQAKKAYEAKKSAEKTAKEAAKKALEAKKKAEIAAKAKAKKEAQAKFASCMQAVIENRDNALITAIDKNREALKVALTARMASQKAAILIEDKVARNSALNKSWNNYRTADKTASAGLRTAKQASWYQFEKAKKTCGEDGKAMVAPKDITSNNNTL